MSRKRNSFGLIDVLLGLILFPIAVIIELLKNPRRK